jgi:autoinducer 2 (AI-2) kinase
MIVIAEVSSVEEKIKKLSEEANQIFRVLGDIITINREMYSAGLITPTGGNVSARISSRPSELWITPSQIFKGELQPDMLVPIDLEGNLLNGYRYRASSERFVHCEIMLRRPEFNAVIHTHPPKTLIMDLANIPFTPISTEAAFLGDIPRVPYIMPGTKELGNQVANGIGAGFAVIMQNHGLVVAGKDLRQAADITHIIERTSEKILGSYDVGKDPRVLSDEAVAQLKKNNDLIA